ncbi:MAG: hypothetical protein E7470_00660 [Ruminococcaceae bacterium]|nr:hypothetical protein [Oscillospiraceae bacterium]
MSCMKCGRDTEEGRTFCAVCLEDMEQHPVRPGTVVWLPEHKDAPVEKKKQHRLYSFQKSADQITTLRNRCRWLTFAFLFTLVCFLIAAFLVMYLVEWHKYFELPVPWLVMKCFT